MKKKIFKVLSVILMICYYPIYLIAIALHWIARLLLAISYFGILDKYKAVDIIKSLFTIRAYERRI